MNYRFIFLSLIFKCLFGSSFQCIGQAVKFQHITSDEKVGFGNVWAIIEDHEGFMWFGTEDGLYKYDGYSIEAFQHSKDDSASLSGNFITCLFEDSNRNLWIGTFGNGLNLYNREENSFVRFKHDANDPHSLPNNRVKTITESQDGTLWFGTERGGIGTFHPENNDPGHIKFNILKKGTDAKSLRSNNIRSIKEDREGNIYVGSFGGLSVMNKDKKVIKHFDTKGKDPDGLKDDKLMEVFIDSKERIWVGSQESGLYLYLPGENKFINYNATVENFTLNHSEVETIAEDKNGTIWVGTDAGLSKMLDSKSPVPKNLFRNYKNEPLDEYSLLSNSVKFLYVDSRNSLWAGTYFGGINVYNDKLLKFHPVRKKPWLKNSLSHNNVTAFAEDKDGNLWVGTDGGGLNFLPGGTDSICKDNYEYIEIRNPVTGNPELKIKTLDIDKDGFVWIGYWGSGMYRLDPKTREIKHYGGNSSSPDFFANNVMNIKVDKKNNLWIGTFMWGISYYNQATKTFTTYLPDPQKPNSLNSDRMRTILIDSKDRVWIGGDIGGLNLFNEKTGFFEKVEYESILTKDISILSLLETGDGKLWIGTVSSGVIIYDPAQKKARSYFEDKGFPNKVIHAMLEDEDGRIWMSTSNGLVRYNPAKESSFYYTKEDGLQGNLFNDASAYKTRSGMLLFGGTSGWNGFFADSIQNQVILPKIAFTNFYIDNKLMNVDVSGSPLTGQINSVGTINLSHDQNSFSVEFAALDYSFTKRNQYAYLLKHFNETWQYIGTDRKASFTNLNPGKYELLIKATNFDGYWSEKDQPLKIIIHPAWWQTSWFKFFSILMILLVIYAVFRFRMKFVIRQSKKLEKEVHQRTAELKSINLELADKNNEILAQNEELSAQNDQIIIHREKLQEAQDKLKSINEELEQLVDQRTQRLKSTIQQLDKTVLELDRFVYSASHDLSAPLKSIRGLLQIAKISNDYNSVVECMNYIEGSITRLEDVIRSLVEYSRNTHYDIKNEPVLLYDFIQEIVDDLAFWPEFKEVQIYNEIMQDFTVNTDKARLKIILHNLISNGIKYSDREKTHSFIRIEGQMKQNLWSVTISDNGIGIEKEEANKIFEMYYRASLKSYGSGLGLYIVKETVNKLGGKVFVDSQPGTGSTFQVELPV